MTDSEVVQKLAGEAGLSADVEDTLVKHKYLFQSAQTNLEFIRERAHRLGWIVQVDRENAKLSFKKPKTGDAKGVMLKWGENLLSHRPRYSTDEMIKGVEVRGWDMTTKKALVGKAEPASDAWSKMGLSRLGPDLLDKDVQVLYPREPMFMEEEAKQMAVSYANQLLHNYAEGEASTQGENKIFPGVIVEVQGCGKRASGNYYVVSTLHHFEGKGYTTYFAFTRPADVATSPKPPPPPPDPVPPPPPDNQVSNKIDFNVVVGKGVPFDKITYTATLPDGTSKQGSLGKDGKVSIGGLKKPGEAKFELKVPPDAKAFQPGEDKKDGGSK
jgi:phage protein D